ncbi:PfkB family carbohydrate kinase [Kribbella sp. CA-294648]|uniref:PfkB family carbohydrate kinase n=1 Tax=Kribbella sp. CA-294648 TaxID=3239948 RepID=UPI003D90D4E8
MHEGLTPARLQRDHRNSAPLLNLPAVQQLAAADHTDPSEAALEIVRQCVHSLDDPTHRLVADAVLALRLFSDDYRASGIPERTIRDLESDGLGRRRTALLRDWQRLHTALGSAADSPPADRTLRETIELRVLSHLAAKLAELGDRPPSVPPQPAARTTVPHPAGPRHFNQVLVIGGAVMDAIFRTKRIPGHETSGRAYDFSLSPGGKGLTQAVAAARLGLDVALVAALCDDQFGDQIIDHLQAANVDISLIKRVPSARTPFTGVFEQGEGDSTALIWRNEEEVSLDPRDIVELTPNLVNCEALLLTFEIPRESVQQALAVAHTDPRSRPLTIVTPGQPYVDEELSRPSLRMIDFMVAHAWELEQYEPARMTHFDPDRVGQHVLSRGVETLCLLRNNGGSIYSDTKSLPGTFRLPTFGSPSRESSRARDVFCAALATKLLEHDRTLTPEVAKWATAAMACTTDPLGRPVQLPDRFRVDQQLAALS